MTEHIKPDIRNAPPPQDHMVSTGDGSSAQKVTVSNSSAVKVPHRTRKRKYGKSIAKYLAVVVVIALAGFLALVAIAVPNSAQYAVYKMNRAAGSGNIDEFVKYYAVKTPGHSASNNDDPQTALDDYKQQYYQPVSLKAALLAKTTKELLGQATIVYIPAGQQQVAMRVSKTNGTWQVVDIAKIDRK